MELTKDQLENARIIADFMGIKEIETFYDNYGTPEPIWYAKYLDDRTPAFGVKGKCVEHLLRESKFETSWDWLMPVVEKICKTKIGDGVEYVEYPYLRTFGMLNEETKNPMVRFNGFGLFEADTLIEATFLAVLNFLKWYYSVHAPNKNS